MTITIAANTPLADALGASMQPKLVEMGWSSDVEDSSPLSEYLVLMLVNGKTEEQITGELSGDLLGLGPEDESIKVFTKWLFEEVDKLSKQLGGGDDKGGAPGGENNSSEAQEARTEDGRDDMMDDEESHVDGIPTGPKAMRQNNNNKNRRPGGIFQQVNKAMERTNDPLRRVRPQGDSTRIQKHDQNRQGQQGNGRNQHNRQNGMGRGFQQNVQNAFGQPGAMGMMGGPMGPNAFGPMMMTPDQQLQFFQMMEQQAKLLSASGFINGMPGQPFPGQQPGFGAGNNMNQFNQNQPSRSLIDRVEGGHRHGKNRVSDLKAGGGEGAESDMSDAPSGTEDGDAMDTGDRAVDACRFGLNCTKADCSFAHPSPVSDPTRASAFVPGEKCQFGALCKNKKCTSSHPSPVNAPNPPAVKPSPADQDCRFWPNCTNPNCQFKHPATPAGAMPPCRNGPNCTRPNCHFTHIALDVPCRFTPCLNPNCVYKHVEGQQQGTFENKIWTPSSGSKPHVSERKFVADEEGEEELIIPGQSDAGATDTDMGGSKTEANTALEVS